MKKILTFIMVAAMILSACVFTAVPAAAADGEWDVFTSSEYYFEDYEGDPQPIPGYEYTDDGFHTLAPDWTDRTPVVRVQTKNKLHIKEGVYMEVRIDAFSYEAGDSWFNFNIWNQLHLGPGSTNEKYGQGVQSLIRLDKRAESAEEISKPGWVYYYCDRFTSCGRGEVPEENAQPGEDGKIYITLEVKWDDKNKTYSVTINGVDAPADCIKWMNEFYGTNDEAHIGIYLHHNERGGKQELTITKFGTTKDTATTPQGDDRREPHNEEKIEYPILDPATVPAGEPAVFLNGDKVNSDTQGKPGGHATQVSVNEDDFSIRASTTTSGASVSCTVKDEVAYDMKDFPVILCLTRNFCTCDDPADCYAIETAGMYFSAGDTVKVDDRFRIRELDMCWDPIVIEEGDLKGSYLYFYVDMSAEDAPFEASGEFKNVRVDFSGVKYQEDGRNEFDVMFIALFRTVDEAEKYVLKYLGLAEDTEDDTVEDDTDEATDEGTTDAAGDVTDETNDGENTETNDVTDAVTESNGATDAETSTEKADETDSETSNGNAENKTEKVTEEQGNDDALDLAAGCGASFGIGGAIVAIAAILGGAISFAKKKED